MSVNRARTSMSPDRLWDVIADPYSYADWVVGAKDVRYVEGSWPQVGSKLHHTVGSGPVELKDSTEVLEVEPRSHIKLKAQLRPFGVAEVDLDLRADGDGTELVMRERFVNGLRGRVAHLLADAGLYGRNRKAVDRLTALAGERSSGSYGT